MTEPEGRPMLAPGRPRASGRGSEVSPGPLATPVEPPGRSLTSQNLRNFRERGSLTFRDLRNFRERGSLTFQDLRNVRDTHSLTFQNLRNVRDTHSLTSQPLDVSEGPNAVR